jgi:hypothetical protein
MLSLVDPSGIYHLLVCMALIDFIASVHVIPEGAVVFTIFPGTPASIGAQGTLDSFNLCYIIIRMHEIATVTVDGAITMSFTANTQGVQAHIGAQVDFLAVGFDIKIPILSLLTVY